MKKLLIASIAALAMTATLCAGAIAADPYGFSPAKGQVVCCPGTIAQVDTSQDNTLLVSIQKTKMNDATTGNADRKYAAPITLSLDEVNDHSALYAEHRGDILLPLIAHRFASDSVKIAIISDYGRAPFKVGWIEGQNKIDSKESV